MSENPIAPEANSTPTPTPESAGTPVSSPVEKNPFVGNEQPETPTEIADEKKLEQPENQFDDLDQDLTDLEESTDTIWLLRRVGIGIIKALLILGGLGIMGWLIWGGSTSESTVSLPAVEKKVEKVIEKSIETVIPVKEEKKPKKNDAPEKLEITFSKATFSAAGRSLSAWNYWLESQRVVSQKGVSAEVLLWKKDVEILFEIPFVDQINGENPISRNYQVGILLQRIDSLSLRATDLQAQLARDITEFSEKAAQAKDTSTIAEQAFLSALKNSDPVGISDILEQKIEAEKMLQQYAVDAEARSIFSQKVSEYNLILLNLQTVLVANRDAIVQNIQVVNFPADPFQRVLSPDSWESR